MPRVTLSFDNGPHPDVTPAVLKTLAKRRIRATFFVIGKNIDSAEGQALIATAHAEGHWIGNHTYHHATPLGRLDAATARWEIDKTDDLIGPYRCPSPLFRPYGQGGALGPHLLNEAAAERLCERGATCIIWNAVPRDWLDPEGWVETALTEIGLRDESLVVLHDIPTGAMKHLDRFIERAVSEGAEFRQDFPEDCAVIRDGEPMRSLTRFIAPG